MRYLYLHGFASSNTSMKAVYFKEKFAELGILLEVLDMNLGDFSKLTVTKQVEFVIQTIAGHETILIGSSLGGLISLIIADSNPNIKGLILLAPAIGIDRLWPKLIGIENLLKWKNASAFPVYHYGYKEEISLHYDFISDLESINTLTFNRPVKTLIFHGKNDETIPIEVSYNYCNTNRNAKLWALESNHSLEDQLGFMWQNITHFLN